MFFLLKNFVCLGSMALCTSLHLDQKLLLLYQIQLLRGIFFEKMHLVMTRYYLIVCSGVWTPLVLQEFELLVLSSFSMFVMPSLLVYHVPLQVNSSFPRNLLTWLTFLPFGI